LSAAEEEENKKKKESTGSEVHYRPLEVQPGSHALGYIDVTPENYEQWKKQQGQQQQEQTERPYTKLGDKKKDDGEDDGGLATAIRQSLDTTLDPYLQEIQRANREKMKKLAQNEIISIPYHKKIATGRTWINPVTQLEEPVYKKGEETWESREFKRYRITKKDWDDAENLRLEAVRLAQTNPVKAKEFEERYNTILAHHFFDMMPEDLQDADYALLKDYIASSVWRTVVGLPYSQEQSNSSLTANTPVR
jgi:hypothetical protein